MLPFLLSAATVGAEQEAVAPKETKKSSIRKLRTNAVGLDLNRQDVAAEDAAAAESARQRKLQSEFITYKYHCSSVFGFNVADNALPVTSNAEILEVLRQTEIFYQRIVAEAFSVTYQDVNLEPSVKITHVSSYHTPSTISLNFQTTVILRIGKVPTSAEVERVLEFFDQSDYLVKFVKNAGPSFAL